MLIEREERTLDRMKIRKKEKAKMKAQAQQEKNLDPYAPSGSSKVGGGMGTIP